MFINPHLTSNSIDANSQNERAQAWAYLNAITTAAKNRRQIPHTMGKQAKLFNQP